MSSTVHDAVRSKHSLLVRPGVSRGNELYNINGPSTSPMIVIRNYLHTCTCACAAATIQGRHLFGIFVVCSYYSVYALCMFLQETHEFLQYPPHTSTMDVRLTKRIYVPYRL